MKNKKYNHIIFSLILLLGSLFTSCGDDFEISMYGNIYGVVTDYETGEYVENVSVLLLPSNMSAITTIEGTFLYEDVDIQQYTIVVQKEGYKTNRKIVNPLRGETINVNITMEKIRN